MSEITTNKALLNKKSQTVPTEWFESGQVKDLQTDIIDTMKSIKLSKGRMPLGLSAPQIERFYQICVLTTKWGFKKTFINPVILQGHGALHDNYETCLSYPHKCFVAKRWYKITVRYLDIHGKVHTKVLYDRLARQLQHEIDHFNGIVPNKEQFRRGAEYCRRKEIQL